MKTIMIFCLILAGLCSPAFAQQVTGYPVYDNVHREHSFDKQQSSSMSTLSLIENNAAEPGNTSKTLTFYNEHMDISTHTVQSYPVYPADINNGLLSPTQSTQIKPLKFGLFLFPKPVIKSLTSS